MLHAAAIVFLSEVVQYIIQSEAGFYMKGVRLTAGTVQKMSPSAAPRCHKSQNVTCALCIQPKDPNPPTQAHHPPKFKINSKIRGAYSFHALVFCWTPSCVRAVCSCHTPYRALLSLTEPYQDSLNMKGFEHCYGLVIPTKLWQSFAILGKH